MIKLDVFLLTDKQLRGFERQEEEGEDEDYNLLECDLVETYFINIDNFGEYIDLESKTKLTSFYSGGMEYISPLEIEDFIKELQRQGFKL